MFNTEGSWSAVTRLIGQAHTVLRQDGEAGLQSDIRIISRYVPCSIYLSYFSHDSTILFCLEICTGRLSTSTSTNKKQKFQNSMDDMEEHLAIEGREKERGTVERAIEANAECNRASDKRQDSEDGGMNVDANRSRSATVAGFADPGRISLAANERRPATQEGRGGDSPGRSSSKIYHEMAPLTGNTCMDEGTKRAGVDNERSSGREEKDLEALIDDVIRRVREKTESKIESKLRLFAPIG